MHSDDVPGLARAPHQEALLTLQGNRLCQRHDGSGAGPDQHSRIPPRVSYTKGAEGNPAAHHSLAGRAQHASRCQSGPHSRGVLHDAHWHFRAWGLYRKVKPGRNPTRVPVGAGLTGLGLTLSPN